MFGLRIFISLTFCLTLLFGSTAPFAQSNNQSPNARTSVSAPITSASGNNQLDGSTTGTIPPGTTITMQNWQQYKQYMPDGMVALFEGKYFWKMPADVRMEVGPTIIHPLPPNYLAATEKYSAQVRIIELPSGGLNLTG